ncbi:MAG: DUF1538 domain-containing protein [Clostridiales bacterium]|jgi:hypothetical protein|nr:DUF1538 domain-containing protein [Clostridiales bacterium]
MKKLLLSKFKEASISVLPILIIVAILNFTLSPISSNDMILFIISSFIMVLGIALFNLGVDMSMMPIGEKIGAALVKSKNLLFIVFFTFIIGIFITVAEPDLLVLAEQINGVPDSIIIFAVALGVGFALVAAILRILFQIKLSYILMACYSIAFILSAFTGKEFISIAYEAGGVTTGPIMVPFIMALGLGLASIRGDKTTAEDSFGLISLCLIGPILTVLILGMFYEPSGGSAISLSQIDSISDIIKLFTMNIPMYSKQIAFALLPILLLFIIFQVTKLHLRKKTILKILVGTVYTFVGLVLFLLSVNVGFMPTGYQLGSILIENNQPWIVVPISIIIGYFVVAAEPAVFVLKEQVEDMTEGAISAKSLGIGLSVGVGLSVGLSMVRILSGLSILYIIIPGYLIALLMTFIVPPIFTSIAFDSGAVASGPLAATFMLPFAIGVCEAYGGNIFTDAFGIVAVVAMTPVVTIQFFGLAYTIKSKRAKDQDITFETTDTILDFDEDVMDLETANTVVAAENNATINADANNTSEMNEANYADVTNEFNAT